MKRTAVQKYPLIVAWGKMMGSENWYIEQQCQLADSDNAHSDSIYKDLSTGEWVIASDVIKQKLSTY